MTAEFDPGPASAPSALFPDVTRDDVFRLETRRLWLRWLKLSDAPALADIAGRREVADMTSTWPHPLPDGEVERRIFGARKANATGNSLVLAIAPRSRPDRLIGQIGIGPAKDDRAGPGELEIGYMLHPDVWGQGLAVEACHTVIDAVFRFTPTDAIVGWTRVINPASRRVLERCGFRSAGSGLIAMPARGGMLPGDQFVLSRKTWAGLRDWRIDAPPPGVLAARVAAARVMPSVTGMRTSDPASVGP